MGIFYPFFYPLQIFCGFFFTIFYPKNRIFFCRCFFVVFFVDFTFFFVSFFFSFIFSRNNLQTHTQKKKRGKNTHTYLSRFFFEISCQKEKKNKKKLQDEPTSLAVTLNQTKTPPSPGWFSVVVIHNTVFTTNHHGWNLDVLVWGFFCSFDNSPCPRTGSVQTKSPEVSLIFFF